MHKTLSAVALSAMVVALPGLSAAAPVTVDLLIEITTGTVPDGSDVSGTTFMGSLTYDDTMTTPTTNGFIADSPMMVFPFLGGQTYTENETAFGPNAEFEPDGTLFALEFAIDEPNVFNLQVSGLGFFYGFVDPNDTNFNIASGNGTISMKDDTGPSVIPLPPGGLLLASGLMVLVGWRRRHQATA